MYPEHRNTIPGTFYFYSCQSLNMHTSSNSYIVISTNIVYHQQFINVSIHNIVVANVASTLGGGLYM